MLPVLINLQRKRGTLSLQQELEFVAALPSEKKRVEAFSIQDLKQLLQVTDQRFCEVL